MSTGSISSVISVAGLSLQSLISRTADGQIGVEVTLPAGQAGTLSTRTDDNTGVATLSTGHGIETSDVCDVYWATGVRYGMTASVSTNDVTLDGGAGDNLPAEDTAVVVTKQVEINADFDGDDAQLVAAVSTQRAHLDFQDSGDASLLAVELAASEGWSWAADTGAANPLTGNAVDTIYASNGTTTEATLKLGVLYDATP